MSHQFLQMSDRETARELPQNLDGNFELGLLRIELQEFSMSLPSQVLFEFLQLGEVQDPESLDGVLRESLGVGLIHDLLQGLRIDFTH